MTKELHRPFLPRGYRVDWLVNSNSPLGNQEAGNEDYGIQPWE
jgi:hypothetical protein